MQLFAYYRFDWSGMERNRIQSIRCTLYSVLAAIRTNFNNTTAMSSFIIVATCLYEKRVQTYDLPLKMT